MSNSNTERHTVKRKNDDIIVALLNRFVLKDGYRFVLTSHELHAQFVMHSTLILLIAHVSLDVLEDEPRNQRKVSSSILRLIPRNLCG